MNPTVVSGLKLKKQLSVLVVDDNRVNRKIVMMTLAKLGVPAHEAENGQEAVNLHIAGAQFVLILIDREMPVMDGPQRRTIHHENNAPHTLSGNTRPSEKQEFMEAGIDEYNVKPMTRPKLICLLQQIDHAADAA
ncbi:hypothetical protein ACLOJK_009513 [Asimina triloba]